MRILNKLYAQHIGWHFKKHWQVQGRRIPRDTGAAAELEKLGIQVKEVKDVLRSKPTYERIGFANGPAACREDESHPNWHTQACYLYKDSNVLLEGMAQAKVLTKTVEIKSFPKNITDYLSRLQLPNSVDRNIENAIMASFVFDAEQVKLPKIKLADRPAYTLPRAYGISFNRRTHLLTNKLIFECEKIAGRSVTSRRKLVEDADFRVTLSRDDDVMQFAVRAEKLLTAARPTEPVKSKHSEDLPELYPIKCTISIPKTNIYTTEAHFPLNDHTKCSCPHTIFLNFNPEFVGNLHETSVTPTQLQSRSLLKAFAVAAAYAKKKYGESTSGTLPIPVVIQSIQTDGQCFHFGIFQLNTLDIGSSGELKNYWFHEPIVNLFTDCGYNAGRPFLNGYNKNVIRYISAFYNNM